MKHLTLTDVLGLLFVLFGFVLIVRCLLLPWRLRRFTKQLLNDLMAGRPIPPSKPRQFTHRIRIDNAVVELIDLRATGKDNCSIQWNDVVRAVAFKRDLWIVDCICLLLVRADDSCIEFDQEMDGWLEFCESLPVRLPGCPAFHEWLWTVASPAFATNQTEIYLRNANAATPVPLPSTHHTQP